MFADMSAGEQQAVRDLGLTQAMWDEPPESGGIYDREWETLSEAEVAAAAVLGMTVDDFGSDGGTTDGDSDTEDAALPSAAPVPKSLRAFLDSEGLGELYAPLFELGAEETSDLAEIEDSEFADIGISAERGRGCSISASTPQAADVTPIITPRTARVGLNRHPRVS